MSDKQPVIELIAIGSELLGPCRLDTNALPIAAGLEGLGLALARKTTISDAEADIRCAVNDSLARADIVITTGGLGPTVDDCTRQVLSDCTSIELRYEKKIEDAMRKKFDLRHMDMPDNNLSQAWVPKEGTWLDNPNGTAPGLLFELPQCIVIALPGPPREMNPMLRKNVIPLLTERYGRDDRVIKRDIGTAVVSESWVDEVLRGVMKDYPNVEVSMLARPGYVDVTLSRRVSINQDGDEELESAHKAAFDALSPSAYADIDATLPEVVGRLLQEKKTTLAVAESCTGGLIGAMLTDIPGSSAYFVAGLCTYANSAKVGQLGVPESLLEEHGAVSAQVAGAMALGVCEKTGADYGLSTTGIAGPEGGTPQKPVGLVYVGVCHCGEVETHELHLAGGRSQVRQRSVAAALDLLRRALQI
jgi:competence/damage-inducible protein CinA-like protein